MNAQPKHIAVITGDLVNSTELGSENIERAFKALERCAEDMADWHGAPLHFTRHRGDGWQVVLARPELALRSALAFRAALRANGDEFDSYMGVADGLVTSDIGSDLNKETEQVFVISGQDLEMVRTSSSHQRISLGPDLAKSATTVLADHISRDWSPTQAEAALFALVPNQKLNMTATAEKLGKSRQAVAKSLLAADIGPLLYALDLIEAKTHA